MLKTFIQKKYNYILICAAVFLVYFPACFYDFVWDDLLLIVNNTASHGLENFFSQISRYPLTENRLIIFRPLTFLSFALNYDLFGGSPFSFHLTNIILHALNMMLVFKLLKILTDNSSKSLTFFCLLYALLPLHAGAVTYVAGRSEILAAFFILLSLLLFIMFTKKEKFILLAASLLCSSLAAFAKETAVVIVPFTFFYTLLFYNKKNNILASVKYSLIPFSLSLAPYTLWRLYYSSHSLHIQTQITKSLISVSLPKRFLVFVSSMPKYLSYLYNPFQKINVEILPVIDFGFNTAMAASFVFIFISLYLMYRWLKNKNLTNVFLLLCFFCGLLPFSNLIIPTMMIPKAHFLYLPGIGITFILLDSLRPLFGRKKAIAKYIILSSATLLLVGTSLRTVYVNSQWRTQEKLYEYNLKQNPEKIYFNQGVMFLQKKKYVKAEEALGKSMAVSLNEIKKIYSALFNLHRKDKELTQSIQQEIAKINDNQLPSYLPQFSPKTTGNVFNAYEKDKAYNMELKKNLFISFRQLKLSLSAASACYIAQEKYKKALTTLNAIMASFPTDESDYGIYYNLGFIYERQSDYKKAKYFYSKSLKLKPDYLQAKEAFEKIVSAKR